MRLLYNLLFMLTSASVIPAMAQPPSGIDWLPIQFRQDSGTRPFIPVLINGKPFLLMVHSNASSYIMTTHANAATAGMTNLGKDASYGISSPGHVSDMGIAHTKLASLRISQTEVKDVPLEVHEIPQTPPTDGMLRIQWLRDQRILVDYDASRLGIPATPAEGEAEDRRLIAQGWTAHTMTWDPNAHRYYVQGKIDGHDAHMLISTIANIVVDSVWAKDNGEPLGARIDEGAGPQGSHVDEYAFKYVVSLSIQGEEMAPVWPEALDFYGYSSTPRPIGLHEDCYLGADFMLMNSAVIDFGTGVLFVKVTQPAHAQTVSMATSNE
jgi:predicted aspartyl protease